MRWFSWGALVLLMGCTVPVLEKLAPEVLPPGKGALVVRWSGESGDRAVLGSAWASSVADAYELVLFGGPAPLTFNLTAGSGQVISLNPGTYQAVVLAGVKRSSGSTTALLVGSAQAEGVVVQEGQRTTVNLVLKSLDLGWSRPAQASWKGALSVTMAGDSRNPRVGMSLSGASTTLRPRFRSADLWGGYRDAGAVSGTPDHWAAEATGTVPDGAPSVGVEFMGATVVLLGADGLWGPTTGLTTWTWSWPTRAELAEGHPLVPITTASVPAGPPPTGVEVGLTWE